jgi:hypothetical protein
MLTNANVDTLFTTKDAEPFVQLLSPYSDEEAVDTDSLYLALRSRWNADKDTKGVPAPYGELFLDGGGSEVVENVNSVKSFFNGYRRFL